MSKIEEVTQGLQEAVDQLPYAILKQTVGYLDDTMNLLVDVGLTQSQAGGAKQTLGDLQEAKQRVLEIYKRVIAAESKIGAYATMLSLPITFQGSDAPVPPSFLPTAKYTFVGQNSDEVIHPEQRIAAIARAEYPLSVREKIANLQLPEIERKKTPTDVAQLEAVADCTTSYLKEQLGIDVSDRLPSVEEQHLLDPDVLNAVAKADLGETYDEDNPTRGFVIAGRDVAIGYSANPADMLALAQHEGCHPASHVVAQVKEYPDGRKPSLHVERHGARVDKTRAFSLLAEGIHEITNQEIVKEKWSANPVLQEVGTPDFKGYPETTAYLRHIFDLVAAKTDMSADEVLKGFQRLEYTGDMSILRTVKDSLGHAAVRKLAFLTRDEARDALS